MVRVQGGRRWAGPTLEGEEGEVSPLSLLRTLLHLDFRMAALRSLPLRPLCRPAATPLLRRRLVHQRVPLPYDLDQGLSPFLSPNALKTVAVDWQQGVLTRLNELTHGKLSSRLEVEAKKLTLALFSVSAHLAGTEVEHLSVLQTIKQTASNPSQTLAFNYASEALNNSFFLSTLVRRLRLSRLGELQLGCGAP